MSVLYLPPNLLLAGVLSALLAAGGPVAVGPAAVGPVAMGTSSGTAADPADREAISRLLAEGRAAEAAARVDEALRREPASRPLKALRARCLFQAGDYPRAEETLRALLSEGSGLSESSRPDGLDRPRLLLELAETRFAQDDLDGAAAAAEEALAGGRRGELAAPAAGIFLRCRRYSRARQILDEAPPGAKLSPYLRYARGTARARTGAAREAVEDLAAAARDPALAVEASFELGLALGKLGDHRRAAEALAQALERNPWHSGAAYGLAQEVLRMGKPRPAAHLHRYFQALQEAEGVSSRDHHLAALGRPAEAALERARRWERMGRFERAIEEIDAAERALAGTQPAGAGETAALAGADFWLRQGLAAEALRALPPAGGGAGASGGVSDRDSTSEKDSAEVLELRGRAAAALGRVEEAEKILARLAVKPERAWPVRLALAEAALERGDVPGAEARLGQQAGADPPPALSGAVRLLRARVLLEGGRWAALLEELPAVEASLGKPVPHWRARALAGLGRPAEADAAMALAASAPTALDMRVRAETLALRGDAGAARARETAAAWEARERAYFLSRVRLAALGRGEAEALLIAASREALALGRNEEAFRLALLAAGLAPRSAAALRQAAEIHQGPTELILRLHFLRRLLELDPTDAAARAARDAARRALLEG